MFFITLLSSIVTFSCLALVWFFMRQEKVKRFYNLINRNNYQEAQEHLTKHPTLMDFKKPSQFMLYKAKLLAHYDRYDDALNLLENVLQSQKAKKMSDQSKIDIHFFIASIAIKNKNYRLAVEHLSACIQHQDKNPETYIKLASIYRLEGRTSESKLVLKIALENSNDNDMIHAELGMILLSENKINKAMEEFSKAYQINYSNPKANFGIAKTKFLSKDLSPELLKNIKLAAKDKEFTQDALTLELQILNALGQYKEIIKKEDIYKPIISKNHIKPLFYIARAYEAIKDLKGALRNYHSILEYDSKNVMALQKIELVSMLLDSDKTRKFMSLDNDSFSSACRNILVSMKYKNIENHVTKVQSVSFIGFEIVGSISVHNPKHYHFFNRELVDMSLEEITNIVENAVNLNCDKIILYIFTKFPENVLDYVKKNNIIIYDHKDFIGIIQKTMR